MDGMGEIGTFLGGGEVLDISHGESWGERRRKRRRRGRRRRKRRRRGKEKGKDENRRKSDLSWERSLLRGSM